MLKNADNKNGRNLNTLGVGRDAFKTVVEICSPKEVELTPREEEILRYFIAGLSFNEMGRRLGISPKTAESNLNSLRELYNAHSRIQLLVAVFNPLQCDKKLIQRYKLTSLETRILDLKLTGLKDQKIAESIKCTLATVRKCRTSAYKKLGVQSHAEAFLKIYKLQKTNPQPTPATHSPAR